MVLEQRPPQSVEQEHDDGAGLHRDGRQPGVVHAAHQRREDPLEAGTAVVRSHRHVGGHDRTVANLTIARPRVRAWAGEGLDPR